MNEMTEPYGDLKSVRRTQRNVDLVLKYGYRFDEVEAQKKKPARIATEPARSGSVNLISNTSAVTWCTPSKL